MTTSSRKLPQIHAKAGGDHPRASRGFAPSPWNIPKGLRVSAGTLGHPTAPSLLLVPSAACNYPRGFPVHGLTLSTEAEMMGQATR